MTVKLPNVTPEDLWIPPSGRPRDEEGKQYAFFTNVKRFIALLQAVPNGELNQKEMPKEVGKRSIFNALANHWGITVPAVVNAFKTLQKMDLVESEHASPRLLSKVKLRADWIPPTPVAPEPEPVLEITEEPTTGPEPEEVPRIPLGSLPFETDELMLVAITEIKTGLDALQTAIEYIGYIRDTDRSRAGEIAELEAALSEVRADKRKLMDELKAERVMVARTAATNSQLRKRLDRLPPNDRELAERVRRETDRLVREGHKPQGN